MLSVSEDQEVMGIVVGVLVEGVRWRLAESWVAAVAGRGNGRASFIAFT